MFDWSGTVYLLCLFASATCAAYLAQAYGRARMRVFLWGAAGFVFLAFANGLGALEALVDSGTDLFLYRGLVTLLGLTLVLRGFIPEDA